MKLTQAKTKKELIHISRSELIRQKRREHLRSLLGNMDIELTLEDLREMRRDEH